MVAQLYRKAPDGKWYSPGRAPLGSADEAERPTGPGYVRYEDLYRPGDSVTDAMNRLTSPAAVTFPPDEFLLTDFKSFTKSGVLTNGAINCDANLVRGIIGSGRGTLGGSTGTVFKMVPNSSTVGGTAVTPTQTQGGTTQVWIVRAIQCASALTFRNFQLVGTAQGHNYHGLGIYKPAGDVTIQNVLISGTEGNNGAPPGETFGFGVTMGSAVNKLLIEDCEYDGRRSTAAGSEWFGAGGFHAGQSVGTIFNRCTAHHTRVSSPGVWYRSFDGQMNSCVWGTTDPKVITNGNRPVSAVNAEVCSNITLTDCTFWHEDTNHGTHITWSNNNVPVTFPDGPTRSPVDGTLRVVNPTWNDVWGNGYFYIQSWTTGVDGTTRRPGRAWGAALGRAHLKTGSLRDSAGIAGYVLSASGRRYVLVAILAHPDAGAGRGVLDALVQWTARDGTP